eukprot:4466161-Lingulodinium_polyedra.AAC.1
MSCELFVGAQRDPSASLGGPCRCGVADVLVPEVAVRRRREEDRGPRGVCFPRRVHAAPGTAVHR